MTVFGDVDTLIANNETLVIEIRNSTNPQTILEIIRQIHDIITGSSRQKSAMLSIGIVPVLMNHCTVENYEVLAEVLDVFTSLSKGASSNRDVLLECDGILEFVIKANYCENLRVKMAALRFLRALLHDFPSAPDILFAESELISHFITLIPEHTEFQLPILSIFTTCCKNDLHQNTLFAAGVLDVLPPLISSPNQRIVFATVSLFEALCRDNLVIAQAVSNLTDTQGNSIIEVIEELIKWNKPADFLLKICQLFAHFVQLPVIWDSPPDLAFKLYSLVIPTLVQHCKPTNSIEHRIAAANSIADLTTRQLNLQRGAFETEHAMSILCKYFTISTNGTDSQSINELRRAGFRALAALTENDEESRTQLLESEKFLTYLLDGLNDPCSAVSLAAATCLHSLTRSVTKLRTSLYDSSIWKQLLLMLQMSDIQLQCVSLATFCNFLLPFSPCRQDILSENVVKIIVEKLKSSECREVRYNALFSLMNVTYQSSRELKMHIIDLLGIDAFHELLSDSDPEFIMKTLGLLRNLISGTKDIDDICLKLGDEFLLKIVFDSTKQSPEVTEQALCLLANMADGTRMNDVILCNDQLLHHLKDLSTQECNKAAISNCVTNLLQNCEPGAEQRKKVMQQFDILIPFDQCSVTASVTSPPLSRFD